MRERERKPRVANINANLTLVDARDPKLHFCHGAGLSSCLFSKWTL